mgnify:CR=1 FL=1
MSHDGTSSLVGLAVLVPLFVLAGGGLVDLADVVSARRTLSAVLVHAAQTVPLTPREQLADAAAARAVEAWTRRGHAEVVARVSDGRLRLEGRVAYPPRLGLLGRRLVLRHVVVRELPGDMSAGDARERATPTDEGLGRRASVGAAE